MDRIKFYETVLTMNPLNENALNSLGWIFYKTGKFDLAAHYFEKCLDIKSNKQEQKDSKKGLKLTKEKMNKEWSTREVC